jgi:hypothetical protein
MLLVQAAVVIQRNIQPHKIIHTKKKKNLIKLLQRKINYHKSKHTKIKGKKKQALSFNKDIFL